MQKLGYGAISKDGDINLYKFGMIHTPRTDQAFNEFINEGIHHISTEFPRLLMFTEPDVIVSELVPPGKLGSNSELVVAAVTVCKVIAYQWGIEWRDIADSTWKATVVGRRDATKAQTRNAVFSHFPAMVDQHKLLKKEQKADGLKPEGFPADITDAIAIGIAGTIIYDIDSEAQKRSGTEGEREAQDSPRSIPALL